ncbi:MAG: DUF262 domain-containing protein [Ignavibacteria bacterium]|nr:DUF262 domain-containing protein [Ignavibacteria bacterium]
MKLIEQIDIQPQTSKWLYDLDKEGLLEIDNSFQRNYVWIEKHQIKLIETILIGFPIPEIYLWDTGTDSDTGDTKYSIIDGQQRTGALFQFIRKKFTLKEQHLNKKYPIFNEIKNKNFKELDVVHKEALWSYIFSVRIVRKQVKREQIVEMFLRLNSNNMTLNPQELRNAEFEGEFLTLSSELAELPFWKKNKLFGVADIRRMRDITFISNILTFMKLGIDEELTSKNINKIYELFNEHYPDKESDKRMFVKITKNIDSIINNESERQKFLNRKVHLYTLINVVFEILLNYTSLSQVQIERYRNFIDNYDNTKELKKLFTGHMSLISEYQALSKEGTNQKSNRVRRFEILSQLIK